MEPLWLERPLVEAVHADQIRQFGGSLGLRDEGLLESALSRPRNRWSYEPQSDLPALAASYGHGLANNRPFVDGNKRIAFLAMEIFVGLNDLTIDGSNPEVIELMLAVADRRCDEEQLALWLREHTIPAGDE